MIERRFTKSGLRHPFDDIEWETRTAEVGSFKQENVEFPKSWSQNATNIVASKYFRGQLGSPTREHSVKQMITRVAKTIAEEGNKAGYFRDGLEMQAFYDELLFILVNQMAAFNSPVWFNVGFEESPQCSACFILSVEDSFDGEHGIKAWQSQEMDIFLGGSGSGVNLSKIRASCEPLSKGGVASGPVSFMRGADSWAGTIKSGGKTRRAAKMVILDADHPDIMHFIRCKADEERKALLLKQAGLNMRLDSDEFASIQYQNANNSVRVTDEFMERALAGQPWPLVKRRSREQAEVVNASDLLNAIAEAAWQCADPGVQFDTTINQWHTTPVSGRINASNPCSEYMHVDNSACNLASINLRKFQRPHGGFDYDSFQHVVDVMILAQDILVGMSSYPTPAIETNAKRMRQLGLGYANLGGLLMSEGLAYDSPEGRELAAEITAVMTGRAYLMSAKIAGKMGHYAEYAKNATHHLDVMNMHRDAAPELLSRTVWDEAIELGMTHGYRNAQATVLAPTGTIAFLMDCDTTGIEPVFAPKTTKNLVGGGTMEIKVPCYQDYLDRMESVAVYVDDTDPVLQTAVGDNAISWKGHVDMMIAVQPFLSGAISKTVNMPEQTTVQEIRDAIVYAWRGGVKALAIYRDGSKTAQALEVESVEKPSGDEIARPHAEQEKPLRRRLPDTRGSITHKFSISGHEGYLHAGMYDDGTLGELFVNMGKEGSTLGGLLDFAGVLMSVALQYGVPLDAIARKFRGMRFEPAGLTKNADIRTTTSIPDYLVRWLVSEFGDVDLQEELGVMTEAVRQRKEALNDAIMEEFEVQEVQSTTHGGHCPDCGALTQTTGTCEACGSCGWSGGC